MPSADSGRGPFLPKSSEVEGELFHAKHALQPNSLGYCGPDENVTILEHLHESTTSEKLDSTLTRFEAAYPFVKMIAKANGRRPFDKEVTEAYWIGNSLLDKVSPSEFYAFTHSLGAGRKRAGRKDGMGKEDARGLFKLVGEIARPHHTFYVLGMYARSSIKSGSEAKLVELMDSCRISWGKVLEVKRTGLVIERPGLRLEDDRLSLGPAERKEVRYDPLIPSFAGVAPGDWVSVHWNFASERLKRYQLRNLRKYTALDIDATNISVASKSGQK